MQPRIHSSSRGALGTVIKPAEDVDVDGDEEERRAVGVHVAQQPAGIHVAHDLLDQSNANLVSDA